MLPKIWSKQFFCKSSWRERRVWGGGGSACGFCVGERKKWEGQEILLLVLVVKRERVCVWGGRGAPKSSGRIVKVKGRWEEHIHTHAPPLPPTGGVNAAPENYTFWTFLSFFLWELYNTLDNLVRTRCTYHIYCLLPISLKLAQTCSNLLKFAHTRSKSLKFAYTCPYSPILAQTRINWPEIAQSPELALHSGTHKHTLGRPKIN